MVGDIWLWYKRRPLYLVGLVVAICGAVTWLTGWAYGPVLTTAGLLIVILGITDLRRLPYSFGMASRYLAERWAARGDLEGALEQAAIATKHFRKLAAHRPAEAHWYPAALGYHCKLLRTAGRHPESLEVAEQAVAAWRDLAERDPQHADRLSRALNQLIVSRDLVDPDHGHRAEIEESITIRRRLMAEQEALLTADLSNLALAHRRARAWAEALPPIEEMVAIRRRLAVSPATRKALVDALELQSDFLLAAGRPTVTPQLEALGLCCQLSAEPNAELAELCGRLAAGLIELDLEAALAASNLAVAVRRELANESGADLATDLSTTGTVLCRMGRPHDALEPVTEALALRRELARDDPKLRPDLAGALHQLGAVHEALREFEPALALSEEALAIVEALAATDHRQTGHLIESLDDHAVLLQRLGRHTEARETELRARKARREHARATAPLQSWVIRFPNTPA